MKLKLERLRVQGCHEQHSEILSCKQTDIVNEYVLSDFSSVNKVRIPRRVSPKCKQGSSIKGSFYFYTDRICEVLRLWVALLVSFNGCGFIRNLINVHTWSLQNRSGKVLGSVALLEEDCHWGWALRVCTLGPAPVCSLYWCLQWKICSLGFPLWPAASLCCHYGLPRHNYKLSNSFFP